MRSILKVKPLEFAATNDGEGGQVHAAYTAFGHYTYQREDDGLRVFSHFGQDEGAGEHFCTAGDAITAQQVCARDFRNRIMESLGLPRDEDEA